MALLAELDADKLPRPPEAAGAAASPTCWRACSGAAAAKAEPAPADAPVEADMRRPAGAAWRPLAAAGRWRRAAARGRGRARAHADAGLASRPLVLILAMAALSLIPFALLMVTSFVRISVVLSILRSAIGTPSVPPTQVLTGLALVLTIAVMAPDRRADVRRDRRRRWAWPPAPTSPAARRVARARRRPPTAARSRCATSCSSTPIRAIARRSSRVTLKMRAPAERAGVSDRDFGVIVPAFVTSELRRAFQIGFLLFIPFLVVDMVIANLLLALGMHMLSPTTVSLPFKLLLFVLADGWHAGDPRPAARATREPARRRRWCCARSARGWCWCCCCRRRR